MPPKSKFSKEQIIDTAFALVERDGADALTARTLGAALGSSARPIFTAFNNMDDVRVGVIERAKARYKSYVDEGLEQTPAFKGVGTAYIRFALERPELFKLLFMRDGATVPVVYGVLNAIDENAERILKSITDGYGLSDDKARKLYLHLWLYTHGIAVAAVTGLCAFSASDISELLTEEFNAILSQINREGERT